jgi:hypothetical protein
MTVVPSFDDPRVTFNEPVAANTDVARHSPMPMAKTKQSI